MRLAVWQGPSPAGDADMALAALDLALQAAGAAGAIMLVGPEVYLPGYNQSDIPARAQLRDGAWLARLSQMAAKANCGLVVGYAERDGDHIYNAAVAIGPDGQTLAHYRKIQLYGPREKAIYTPGDNYVIFDLAGTRATILICYDIEFAPHVSALAARGVTLFLVPTANMMPFTHVVRATVPAMAANHGITIAYANYCGIEGDLTYVGGSLIAGPHGEVLAQAGEGPALLIVDVPAADPARLSTQNADFRKV
jgi:5-aminopentanamidase